MAIHSSILAWKIPWTEGLSQRVRHDLVTERAHTHTHTHTHTQIGQDYYFIDERREVK